MYYFYLLENAWVTNVIFWLLKNRFVLDCDWDYTDFSQWGKCSYTCGYETNQEKGSPIDIVTANAEPNTFTLSTPDGGNIESESYRDVMHSFMR